VRRLLVLLGVLALTLAACGGDDSTTGESAGTAAQTTTPQKENGADEQPAEPPPAREGENLVTGSTTIGFEDGTAGFVEFNGAKIAQDNSEASAGKGSLRVDADGDSPFQGTETVPIPVKPGKSYAAIFDVRAPEGTALQLVLRESDADGKEVDAAATAVDGTGKWETVAVEKEFGADGENAVIQVRTGEKPEEVTFFIDRPTLQESAGG
jgi:carbohydrate binding protein with CBM4/9 domain